MSAVVAWLNFPFPGAWAAGLLLFVLALLLAFESRDFAERQRTRRAWMDASYREAEAVRPGEQCLVICMEGNLTYANCHGESDSVGVLTLYTRDKPAGKNRVLRTFGPGEWLSYQNGEMSAPAEVAEDDPD